MASWDAPPTFEDYVRARHAELLRFAYALSGDVHIASDLVQDALERTGMRWRQLRQQGDPDGYLRRIIVNRHLSWRRALRRERLVAEVPERTYAEIEQRDVTLWRLLATLPRQQRAVLVLRFYSDLTEVQVAEVLGCTVGTVKSTSSRALAKLRAALAPAAAVEGGQP